MALRNTLKNIYDGLCNPPPEKCIFTFNPEVAFVHCRVPFKWCWVEAVKLKGKPKSQTVGKQKASWRKIYPQRYIETDGTTGGPCVASLVNFNEYIVFVSDKRP